MKPCKKCGHPRPLHIPKHLIDKDPRHGKVFCASCGKDITYDTHQWRHEPDNRWVCCECMSKTKGLQDMLHPQSPKKPKSYKAQVLKLEQELKLINRAWVDALHNNAIVDMVDADGENMKAILAFVEEELRKLMSKDVSPAQIGVDTLKETRP